MTERERYSVLLHLLGLGVGLFAGCGFTYGSILRIDSPFRDGIINITGFLSFVLPIPIGIALIIVVLRALKITVQFKKIESDITSTPPASE